MNIFNPLVLLSVAICLISANNISATNIVDADSDSIQQKYYLTKPFKAMYAGVPLIAAGLAMQGQDKNIKGFRTSYAPSYKVIYDDYTQYLPAATMLGLKIAGVKGRSSWGRMLTSDAFTVALMASTVNLMKHTIKTVRPDGSNNHSFPSGHTATAFMCATMLHKEYGHISPWISVGGYTVATFTGMSRIMNNKHWVSDVLTGAGIGILSTEFGYMLADAIFQEKGFTYFKLPEPYPQFHKPSFLGLKIGVTMPLSKVEMPNAGEVKLMSGANAGLEGAYYFNPYIGLGGQMSITNFPVKLNNSILPETIDFNSLYGGVYYSYPLLPQFQISARTLIGHNHYKKFKVKDDLTLNSNNNLSFQAGLSTVFVSSKAFNIRLSCEYIALKNKDYNSSGILSALTLSSTASINF